MIKQTAIDWLVEQINADCLNSTFIRKELIDQAKAMEKEQIMNAVDIGFEEGSKFPEDIRLNNSEEYYNETFNNISEKGLKDDV